MTSSVPTPIKKPSITTRQHPRFYPTTTEHAQGMSGYQQCREHRAWRLLREIVVQRAPPSVRRPHAAMFVWQTPRRRALFHYARLIEFTPMHQPPTATQAGYGLAGQEDTPEAVNRQAKAAARRLTRATHADQQAQQSEAWRQTADAVSQHSTRNASHTEEIRKAQAGLRAERRAGNRDGVQAWRRLLWQLHGNQQG